MPSFPVLYEDNHLLVIDKPAGLPTQGAQEGEESVVTRAKAWLKAKYNKPGNVFVGVVSRLDAMVSGVLVLAKTSKGAARLAEQFRLATTEKRYWALVDGVLPSPELMLEHWLVKDEPRHCMRVADKATAGAQLARLRYSTLVQLPSRRTLLEIELETGRKHQIRIQLATLGHPIVGDVKYGSAIPFSQGIALHSRRLTIDHPTRPERLTFVAPLPASWNATGVRNHLPPDA